MDYCFRNHKICTLTNRRSGRIRCAAGLSVRAHTSRPGIRQRFSVLRHVLALPLCAASSAPDTVAGLSAYGQRLFVYRHASQLHHTFPRPAVVEPSRDAHKPASARDSGVVGFHQSPPFTLSQQSHWLISIPQQWQYRQPCVHPSFRDFRIVASIWRANFSRSVCFVASWFASPSGFSRQLLIPCRTLRRVRAVVCC